MICSPHIAYEWQSAIRHPGTHSTQNYCTRCFHFSPECTKIVGSCGSAPDPTGGAYIYPRMKSMTTGWKSNLMNASSMNEHTLLEIIAPDASISVQNAAKLLAGWGSAPDPAYGAYINHFLINIFQDCIQPFGHEMLSWVRLCGINAHSVSPPQLASLASWYQFYCLVNRDTRALVVCPEY